MNRDEEHVMKPSVITACDFIGIFEKWISSNHIWRSLLRLGVAIFVFCVFLMLFMAGLGMIYKHLLCDWMLANKAWRLIMVECALCVPVILLVIGLGLIKNYLRIKEDYRYKIFLLVVYKELISTDEYSDDAQKMLYDVFSKNFMNSPSEIL